MFRTPRTEQQIKQALTRAGWEPSDRLNAAAAIIHRGEAEKATRCSSLGLVDGDYIAMRDGNGRLYEAHADNGRLESAIPVGIMVEDASRPWRWLPHVASWLEGANGQAVARLADGSIVTQHNVRGSIHHEVAGTRYSSVMSAAIALTPAVPVE